MPDVLKRFGCPVCGENIGRQGSHIALFSGDPHCPGTPVERTYVAIDALLSDAAVEAATRTVQKQSGLPSTARFVLEAAVRAVTGEGT